MRFLNIAFDLDSTLIDFHTVFTHIVASTFGLACKRPEAWDLESAYGITDAQRKWALDLTYEKLHTVPIYDGVRDFLKLLWLATGDPISIISARPISSATVTHKLVDACVCRGIPYVLTLTGDNVGKLPHLRGFKYYAEDNSDVAWLLATQTDTKVFLVKQPYNKGLVHTNIRPIDGIKDLLKMPMNTFWEER